MEGGIDSAQLATNWHAGAIAPCGYDGASASPEDPNKGNPDNGRDPSKDYDACVQQANAIAAPYFHSAKGALPTTAGAASAAIISGAGAGVAKAGGTPTWASVVGGLLGAISPFGESAIDALGGQAIYNAALQQCMVNKGYPVVTDDH